MTLMVLSPESQLRLPSVQLREKILYVICLNGLFTWLAIYSLCILTICNFRYESGPRSSANSSVISSMFGIFKMVYIFIMMHYQVFISDHFYLLNCKEAHVA